MTSYSASKAGVEGLSNSLRGELAARGVAVGCAYFGLIDTDMVREAFAHPSTTAMLALLPRFVRRPVSVEQAVAAIELGIQDRRARIWAPRYVGAALLNRGWLQPLTELWVRRSGRIERAVGTTGQPGAGAAAASEASESLVEAA
jgi:NAD(P)-dependent dehydrogenase (short-subunit alcohol dehydrogenase family)